MGETDQITERPATDTQPDYTVLNEFLNAFQAQQKLNNHRSNAPQLLAEGGEVSQPNPTGGITPEIEFLLNNFVADTRPQPMMQPQPLPQPSPLAAMQQIQPNFGR